MGVVCSTFALLSLRSGLIAGLSAGLPSVSDIVGLFANASRTVGA